jgi:hypothetical protein
LQEDLRSEMNRHYLAHFYRFFPVMHDGIYKRVDIRAEFDRVLTEIAADQGIPGFTESNENLKILHTLRLFSCTKVWAPKSTDMEAARVYIQEIMQKVEMTKG